MAVGIRISLNEGLYVRDPQDTPLGRRIIKHSIMLIDEIGFEAFTFRKLAAEIGSTEASVYRYFENKHLLLLYLVSWYWEWVSYSIDINARNVYQSEDRLRIVIGTIVGASRENPAVDYVNESVLHRIVIAEGTKAYHTKTVDEENKEGFFLSYKRLAEKVADVILEVEPSYPYPRALATSLFEMTNNHIYFAQHLPRLTDVRVVGSDFGEVEQMLEHFAFSQLGIRQDELVVA